MNKSAYQFKDYLLAPLYRFSRYQSRLLAVLLGVVGFAIVVYFTATQLPNVLAYNDTTKTWTFNTANAGSYTYDTALVTVDDSGARPVTGANKIVNPAFATDISSWSSSANAPTGWVEVPGDGTFSTSNFLVMKYEAKCASTSTPTVGLTSPADATYEVYRDDGAVTPANNCTDGGSPDNNRVVASLASGYPIAYINQTEANTRCGTVAVGATTAHLTTDPEWMTIATNAQGQNTNWSLGTVGNGYLYAGHNDNSPAKARVASSTDTNRAAYTDAGGTTEALTTATNTAIGQSGSVGAQVRTLVLSNGSALWDIAGNVWEWTNKIQSVAVNTTAGWVDWNHANVAAGARALYGSSLYLSNQGTGQVYGGALTNGFLRGGNWYGSSYTGAFTLTLDTAPSTRYVSIGFRCTSDPVAISQSFSSSSGRADLGAAQIAVGTVADAKFVQSITAGDTATYDLSVYVRDATAGNEGGTVSSAVAELYYNGATITTSYAESPVGSGWWKLAGTLTGSASAREYGLLVKRSKTILVDDATLAKTGTYSVYTTTAYTTTPVTSWDSFTANATATGNASVGYQICLTDGSACGYVSDPRWQYYTGGVWANATGGTQNSTVAELTQAAMQALPVTSQKISVKAIMQFGGADTPALSTVSIGLTTDTTPPSIALTALSPDPNNDNTPTLSGTATEALGTVTAVQYQMDGTDGSWSACTASDGSFNSNSEAFTCTTSPLSDGAHTMNVRATDSNGNTTANGSVSSDTFIIDIVAPSGGSITYSDGYTGTTSVSLTVSDGTDATAGINTSSRIVQRKSATLTSGSCGTYSSYATITPTGTYPNLTDSTVASGNCYEYQYLVADNATNQVTYTSSNVIKVDTSAPSAPGTPSTTSPISALTQTWAWTAATDALSSISNYIYKVTTDTAGLVVHTAETTLGNVLTVNTNLTDGIFYFFVKAGDIVGNIGSYASYGEVVVDTTAPIGGSVIISSGAAYTKSREVTLSLTATSATHMMLSESASFAGASWETYATSKNITLTSTDGTKTVYVKFKDGVDNVSSTVSDTIILDTTFPVLTTIDTPTSSSTSTNPAFKFSLATDTNGIANYAIIVNQDKAVTVSLSSIPFESGESKSETILKNDSDARVLLYNNHTSDTTDDRLSITFPYLASHPLPSGENTFKLMITDNAGNVTTKEMKFNVGAITQSPTSTPTPTPTPQSEVNTAPYTSPSKKKITSTPPPTLTPLPVSPAKPRADKADEILTTTIEILDTSGKPVPHTVIRVDDGGEDITSDEHGFIRLPALAQGTHKIQVISASDGSVLGEQTINLNEGETKKIQITIQTENSLLTSPLSMGALVICILTLIAVIVYLVYSRRKRI